MPNGAIISSISSLKSIPLVGNFVSNIFKKPQTKDGMGKLRDYLGSTPVMIGEVKRLPCVAKWLQGQALDIDEATVCRSSVRYWIQNWTKAQKTDIEKALAGIQIIVPLPSTPVEVHTVSASYSPQAQTQTIDKSRDVQEVVQAGISGISKIPIYVWLGIGTLFILPQLLKGGKK